MYIYKITNLLNGKFYIGQTINYKSRWDAHKRSTYSDIGKAINQYGVDSFSFKVLFECNQRDANLLESYLILKYDTINNGYNKVLSKKMDDIDIKKAERLLISIRDKTYVLTGEYMAKSGDKRPVYCLEENLTFSNAEECRTFYNIVTSTRVRDICLGKRATANGLTFRFLDENGDIVQPENCAKKKEKPIFCEELNTIYPSIAEACRQLGLDVAKSKASISKCAYGQNCVTAYGYHWKWAIDDEFQENNRVDKRKRKVIVDDKYVYESISDACRDLGLGVNADINAGLACRGKYNNQFALGHKWQYLDKDNNPIIIETDNKLVSNIPLLVDDKFYFNSINAAVKYFNLNDSARATIKRCCDRDYDDMHNEAYGHSWSYVDIIDL